MLKHFPINLACLVVHCKKGSQRGNSISSKHWLHFAAWTPQEIGCFGCTLQLTSRDALAALCSLPQEMLWLHFATYLKRCFIGCFGCILQLTLRDWMLGLHFAAYLMCIPLWLHDESLERTMDEFPTKI